MSARSYRFDRIRSGWGPVDEVAQSDFRRRSLERLPAFPAERGVLRFQRAAITTLDADDLFRGILRVRGTRHGPSRSQGLLHVGVDHLGGPHARASHHPT